MSWGNNTNLFAREKRVSGECKQHGNMNLCNEKQNSALNTTKEGHNVLITGQCGTGASFLLSYC